MKKIIISAILAVNILSSVDASRVVITPPLHEQHMTAEYFVSLPKVTHAISSQIVTHMLANTRNIDEKSASAFDEPLPAEYSDISEEIRTDAKAFLLTKLFIETCATFSLEEYKLEDEKFPHPEEAKAKEETEPSSSAFQAKHKSSNEGFLQVTMPKESEIFLRLFHIAKNKHGKQLLHLLIAHHKTNDSLRKIAFMEHEKAMSLTSNSTTHNLKMLVVSKQKEPIFVYSAEGKFIQAVFPYELSTYHELLHILHEYESPDEIRERRNDPIQFQKTKTISVDPNKLKVAQRLFTIINGSAEVFNIINHNGSVTKCSYINMIKHLYFNFQNDEEVYTMFGIKLNKEGKLVRDELAEATFAMEEYGWTRLLHMEFMNKGGTIDFEIGRIMNPGLLRFIVNMLK
ncbi:MAG: hypothetical protein IJT36_06020 [Alphaproteobacteria bacterium]|nr:hypothetical protein [Alphaproteobacteria bacterium]